MMYLCRDLFHEILDTPGKLAEIFENTFYFSKDLYNDIIDYKIVDKFQDFILKKYHTKKIEMIDTSKNPFELITIAGYTLYECNTEDDIQTLREIHLPSLKVIGDTCMFLKNKLSIINLPKLIKMGAYCFDYSQISDLYLPKLESCTSDKMNTKIKKMEKRGY